MHHEVDRQSMMNDIILTIALILSLAIVSIIAHVINLQECKNKLFIFSVLTFFFIKTIYNGIIHSIKLKNKRVKGTK